MILSKAKIKYFASFSQKKTRDSNRLFVAEGTKLVLDLLPHFRLSSLVATSEWLDSYASILDCGEDDTIFMCDNPADMARISQLSTPASVFALFSYPDSLSSSELLDFLIAEPQLVLALDTVQNPGNLGTIIRVADWFGIHHILCSQQTADVFNPKVVQATMGALSRVSIHYVDLTSLLTSLHSLANYPVYGTFLDGDSIYSLFPSSLSHSLSSSVETPLPNSLSVSDDIQLPTIASLQSEEIRSKLKNTQPLIRDKSFGVIVMGNEGGGISSSVGQCVSHRLLIPSFPPDQPTSESLNVAIATAIIVSEFRRP